jgi:colicin import membrane protein
MVGYSAVAHLIVFYILLNFQFPAHFAAAPVYYVDVLDLPVAHPQAGTPGGAEHQLSSPQPAPPAPAAPTRREMTLPTKPTSKPSPKTTAITPKQPEAPENAREFEERIARLERDAAARHEAAALDTLRKRVGSRGVSGMPGGTGNEAGSDYASYIQSRLRDAFKSTIAFQSKTPEVVVRITISRGGRISRVRTERTTGDKVFEDAVSRAIAKAERNFPPPPQGEEFDLGFVFRPQGVGKN